MMPSPVWLRLAAAVIGQGLAHGVGVAVEDALGRLVADALGESGDGIQDPCT